RHAQAGPHTSHSFPTRRSSDLFQKWESWSGELRRLLARAEWPEVLDKVEEAKRSGFPDDVQLSLIKFKALEALGRIVESAQVIRSEEHTSELQSLTNLVCRLLL